MKIITALWFFTFICSQVVLGQDRVPTLEDAQYKMACGPIAGDVDIVPAQLVFGQTSTEEIVRTCVLSFQKGKIDPEKIMLTVSHSNVHMKLEKSGDNTDELILTVRWLLTDKITKKLVEGTIVGRDTSGKTVFSIPYIVYQNDL